MVETTQLIYNRPAADGFKFRFYSCKWLRFRLMGGQVGHWCGFGVLVYGA